MKYTSQVTQRCLGYRHSSVWKLRYAVSQCPRSTPPTHVWCDELKTCDRTNWRLC